jgi:hypothetical protein
MGAMMMRFSSESPPTLKLVNSLAVIVVPLAEETGGGTDEGAHGANDLIQPEET